MGNNCTQNKTILWLTTIALVLALLVVMLGAYTRLTDAGLGCPDWPGCYGHMVLPSKGASFTEAQQKYPSLPIESAKAWTEMIHRYAAGTLGVLILCIAVGAMVSRYRLAPLPWKIPMILIGLVLFQAALGMWTVTLKLLPVVVMGHLIGGMLIFALLCCYRFQLSVLSTQNLPQWRYWIGFALFVVFVQIALGGWVSSNYAGIACIGFPTCNGVWLPVLHFVKGFNLFSSVSANYQGGVLDNHVRVTIQYIHRLGALATLVYGLPLAMTIIAAAKEYYLRMMALLFCMLLLLQLILGIMNVIYLLPLPVAVLHNGVAALLLATLLCMLQSTFRRHSNEH